MKPAGLQYNIETPLHEPIVSGLGASLILEGWAFCQENTVTSLTVDFDGRRVPVAHWANARQDVLVGHASTRAAENIRALRSGFWTVVPIPAVSHERQIPLRLVARLDNGEALLSPYHMVRVAPSPNSAPSRRFARGTPLPDRPRVCICMTTYNPPDDVFRRQIDSIRAQDHDNWICLVQDDWSRYDRIAAIRAILGDDPRFILQTNSRNLGFYRNFERVLSRVPEDCDLVCLADQDDRWYPGKLSALIAGFTSPDTTLVYSDMRVVDEQGQVVSDTFWANRRNNWTDFETLFFANTVTGAAAMFRASLLPLLLPFPRKRGNCYHDWWLGLVALAAGRIRYLDQPLYDYYQHTSNAAGWRSHIFRTVSVRQFVRSDAYRRELANVARMLYNDNCKLLAAAVQTLRLRFPESDHNAALKRLGRLTERPLRTLLAQYLRSVIFRRPSENREKHVLMAHGLIRMLNVHFTRKFRELMQQFATAEEAAAHQPLHDGGHLMPVDTFERKCAPLNLDIRPGEPPRVNVLLATIDFRYFFGGYIGMFQLAKHIAQAGFRTRFVIVERCDFQPDVWRQMIRRYAGLEDIFDLVEVSYNFDRAKPLPVSPDDRFVATSCWSAWVADNAARQLGGKPFVFMIQEYEPYFVPHGSYYAISHAAYDLNLFGVFSTEFLRDFFRHNRFGVYRDGIAEGDRRSIAFNNAILKFHLDEGRLRRHAGAKRKLLFYCRPEPHAQRNMFELGVLALRRAIRDGALDPAKWDFFGIGTVGEHFIVSLGDNAELVALPRMSLQEYGEYLPDFDLGLSLMYTPHPSLVPLEMASAGLITVTNHFANKTAEALRAISPNFEVGECTIDDLAAALKRAEVRVDDYAARAAGAKTTWPTSWDEAFAPDVIQPMLDELRQGSRVPCAG